MSRSGSPAGSTQAPSAAARTATAGGPSPATPDAPDRAGPELADELPDAAPSVDAPPCLCSGARLPEEPDGAVFGPASCSNTPKRSPPSMLEDGVVHALAAVTASQPRHSVR